MLALFYLRGISVYYSKNNAISSCLFTDTNIETFL